MAALRVLWWTFGVGRAMFDFSQHGTWALRDAAHVLESLFLLVGFVFAGQPKSFDRFFDWLPKMLVVCVLYGMLYPLRDQLWSLSPTIMSGSGYPAPIFFSMANTPQLLIMAAFYLILFHSNRLLANVVLVMIIGYTVAVFQARTLYLILFAIFAFLAFYRRSTVGNLGILAVLSAFLLALITLVGLHFQGRLGATFSAEFLVAHFLAIFGICDPSFQGVCSAAEGVDQRLQWWTKIYNSMIGDPFSLLLGLGYGLPLTDFHSSTGAQVREPHNSYITVVARTGIIGAVCWARDDGEPAPTLAQDLHPLPPARLARRREPAHGADGLLHLHLGAGAGRGRLREALQHHPVLLLLGCHPAHGPAPGPRLDRARRSNPGIEGRGSAADGPRHCPSQNFCQPHGIGARSRRHTDRGARIKRPTRKRR